MTAGGQFLFRDVQAMLDAGKMVDLGRYPENIILYGTAYYMSGDRYYFVSKNEEKILKFLLSPDNFRYYPIPLQSHTTRVTIPKELRLEKTNNLKIGMAKYMQTVYPKELFTQLQFLNHTPNTKGTELILTKVRKYSEAIFNYNQIMVFRMLLTLAYMRKSITETYFNQNYEWTSMRLKEISSFTAPYYGREKTIYGLMYWSGGTQKYYTNAVYHNVYYKQYELQLKGHCVTPITELHYLETQYNNILDMRKQFEADISSLYKDIYKEALFHIMSYPSVIDKEKFEKVKSNLASYSAETEHALNYYGVRWGLNII